MCDYQRPEAPPPLNPPPPPLNPPPPPSLPPDPPRPRPSNPPPQPLERGKLDQLPGPENPESSANRKARTPATTAMKTTWPTKYTTMPVAAPATVAPRPRPNKERRITEP